MKRDKVLIVRDMKEKGNVNYDEGEKLELSDPMVLIPRVINLAFNF